MTHSPRLARWKARPTELRLQAAPALPTQHPRCEQLQVLRIRGTRSTGIYKYETIVLPKAQAASSRPGAGAQQPHLPLRLLLCAALIIVRVGKIKGFRGCCQGPGCCLPALCVTHARRSRPLSATCPSRQYHPTGPASTAAGDRLSSPVLAGPGGGRDSAAGSGQGNWGPVKGKDLSTALQRSRALGPPQEPSPWGDPVLLARSPEALSPGQFPVCKQPRSMADLGPQGSASAGTAHSATTGPFLGLCSAPIWLVQETPGGRPRCSCPKGATLGTGWGPNEEGNTSTPGRKRKR